ncbi:orotidine-5'-phosphate decarboxylase [Rhabdaerophilum calidifontis]|uniref:orotidine-5'-phosphate decarboxylase n=1 Tax=Rhabdaerophilum calidifontis TaxID=2604328 RepID=UPI00123A57A5|nr:orotidine-5'-phosphate decarboxylase [Rhabdaerophilum calidifontis]
MEPEARVIVALDLPDIAAARALVATLGAAGRFYKIGYELAFAGGLDLARELVAAGKQVFLDLKLHDIPNTIEKGVGQIARLGATFLTVHAYPQTLEAAARGAAGSGLGILGVSVMTSMDDADLARAGYGLGVADLVARRARQTYEAGCAGLICSAADIAGVRAAVGQGLTLVTPGIRPAGSAVGDQKRVMTPGAAIRAGADHLVIGRPISAAPDPAAALAAILAEIAST